MPFLSVIWSVIATMYLVLRESATHPCAELSSLVLLLYELCYLLGPLGPSGGEPELDQIVFCSCGD